MKYELKNYSFGQTIGKGLNLYFDNFLYVVGISLILYLPALYLGFFAPSPETEDLNVTGLYGLLYFMIIGFFLSAFIIHIVSKKYLGKTLSTSDYIGASLPLLISIFLLSLLETGLILLGFILLIVPGLILAVGFSVSVNALVVERLSPVQSLRRSWRLTRGKRWPILGLMVLYGVTNLLVTYSIILLIANIYPNIYDITGYILSALSGPIGSCIFVVVYFNLRVEKEGFNVEHLAEQFSLTDDPE
ncbi:MAG TPA: hypothetical protein ENI73_03940 [Spirochaetes bacterium]|nr:hypothetical protein [Spirochaetota bacterium]